MKDKNAWNLETYLAKQIAEGTKKLLLWDHGHPTNITHEEWREILKKINSAFWKYHTHEEKMTVQEYTDFINGEEWDEAGKLLMKWFPHLWD